MNPKILRYIYFGPDPFGHGGEKRSQQISELIEANGINWEKIPDGLYDKRQYISNRRKIRLFSLFVKVYKTIKAEIKFYRLYKIIKVVGRLKKVFEISGNYKNSVLFWETTKMETSYMLPLAKKNRNTIIAFPHNIEALVYSQKSPLTEKPSPDWLMEEITLLRQCDHIFAISKEETLFFKQCGLKADYLPYYPPSKAYEYLLNIRNKREQKKIQGEKRKILMLGTVINPPTKKGFEKIISFFIEKKIANLTLFVAGYGTESLNCYTDEDHIIVKGTLTQDELGELLIEADLMLIYQPATSGALTRIIETIVAGIPVLCNFESGRDYYGMDGVNIYYDLEELKRLVLAEYSVPKLPDAPAREYQIFDKILKRQMRHLV